CAPMAAKDTHGWLLRLAPGQRRTHSDIAPMCEPGVTSGSNGGVCKRIVSHHDFGTGGFSHPAGSVLLEVCVGTTSVPSGPSASRSASTTATCAPHTQPRLLRLACV